MSIELVINLLKTATNGAELLSILDALTAEDSDSESNQF